MFPPAIWNVHDATVNGDARTSNMCEGWNNKFFNLVEHAHPSTCIWRVIEWCQKEEATVRTIIQQDAVGNPPAKRPQQRHVQLQERLQNLCRDLTTDQKTIAEFLCGVGWNIISAQETIDTMNIYNFKLDIFNVCMFINISLYYEFSLLCIFSLVIQP